MLSQKTQMLRALPWGMLVFATFAYIGVRLDAHENERLTKFRDKSALYGRELKPGEPPSWP